MESLLIWRKKYNLFIIIIILCCSVQCSEKTQTTNIEQNRNVLSYDSLIKKYTREKVYIGTYFTNKCFKNNFEYYKKNIQYNTCDLAQEIDTYMHDNTYKSCAINNIKEINKWCSIEAKLNEIPIQSDEGVTFEEIIYNMKIGKKLYAKYLKDKKQYYGSLDFQQSCSLYYDVVNYLYNSDSVSYKNFMQEYFDYYRKLGSS
ncbi:hypothetical protein ABXT08_15220 [Chryseobacterium sp. NRRL B-14859]|uniref:hypothetical protein n=1 Tax=Chryseobacterium sp. NRRL B-14859 TaxID=1562763 RepID=UPI00339238C8